MLNTTFDQGFDLAPYLEDQLGYVPPSDPDLSHDSEIDRKVRIFLERTQEYLSEYREEYRDGKIYLHPRWEQ